MALSSLVNISIAHTALEMQHMKKNQTDKYCNAGHVSVTQNFQDEYT